MYKKACQLQDGGYVFLFHLAMLLVIQIAYPRAWSFSR